MIPTGTAGRMSADEEFAAEVFLKGTVSRITYRNEQSGFAVLRADPTPECRDGGSSSVTVVGVVPVTLSAGVSFIARGRWRNHPKFGRQFRAFSLTEAEPAGAEALLRYLSSGAVKGFGPVLAQRVVECFGDRTLEILDRSPERLREVPGIGSKKLAEIQSNWQQKRNQREVLLFFQGQGIAAGTSMRIYNAYGERAIEIVRENPYTLIRDIWGIGFQTADKIALALGIDSESAQRLAAGLVYSLKRASDDGHCYLPFEILKPKAASLLNIADEEKLESALQMLISEGQVVRSGECCYLPHLFQAESALAESIADRLSRAAIAPMDPGLIERACTRGIPSGVDADGNPKIIRLSIEQQEAIRLAGTHPLLVVTGGPGCGKTTVTRTIASLFREAGLRLKLAAPTGRAAQRLAEVCGMEASTIHRLLKFDPSQRRFLFDENDPLPLDALIVDESSMVDLPLAASLFRALPRESRVVIVGDADQLPSVGPGLFLADLLNLPVIPRVKLTNLFRRANESSITGVAHRINCGSVPEIPEFDGGLNTDAYFVSNTDPGEIASRVENLVCDEVPRRFGYRPTQITVLTPMNQGEIGVIALNQRLQRRLIPSDHGATSAQVGNLTYYLGDRVCQRVNNYSIHPSGVFNGDQGEVIGIDTESHALRVRLWDGREIVYSGDALYQLDLAYALSIHRSQGSEVPVVILVLHDSHTILLERQLIYTAVTRAKNLLIIVGSKRALILSVKRNRSRRRYTNLVGQVQAVRT